VLRRVLELSAELEPAAEVDLTDEGLRTQAASWAAHPKWSHLQRGLNVLATGAWLIAEWGPAPWLAFFAAALACRMRGSARAPVAQPEAEPRRAAELAGFVMVDAED